MKYPETSEKVGIYIGNIKEVQHFICGKQKSQINFGRAQKLLWINFLIEEEELRDVFLENETQNMLFVSEELNYIVVTGQLIRKNNSIIQERRVITMYVKSKKEIQKMYCDPRYKILHK